MLQIMKIRFSKPRTYTLFRSKEKHANRLENLVFAWLTYIKKPKKWIKKQKKMKKAKNEWILKTWKNKKFQA